MAILPIKKYPHPILRQKAKKVTRIRKRTLNLIHNMIETMYAQKGIGLAANQVGVLQRIIIVDITPQDERNNKDQFYKPIVFINPKILSAEGENVAEEGCLSFPGIIKEIKRATQIKVRSWNVNEEIIEIEASGLPARIIQHEIDHLNGILFIDHLDEEVKKSIQEQLEILKKGNLFSK